MVLVFKSNLGKNVSHDCLRMGDIYITKTNSRLRFRVVSTFVFLTGGCSQWNGAKGKWTEGPFHFFSNDIPMGRTI